MFVKTCEHNVYVCYSFGPIQRLVWRAKSQHTFVVSLSTYRWQPKLPFDVIDHKFMIPGHSYLPNDQDFGVIEQAKRRHTQINIPQEWHELVHTSCRSNPLRVIEMETKDFVAIMEL